MKSRNWLVRSLLFATSSLGCCTTLAQRSFYVATTGSDINPGTEAFPFLTLHRAQEQVRELRRQMVQSEAIHVYLKAGRYELNQTWAFAPEDSGASSLHPITYQAYCDPRNRVAASFTIEYPYPSGTAMDLRYIWNGVGKPSDWTGLPDGFKEMGVDAKENVAIPAVLNEEPSEDPRPMTCIDRVDINQRECYLNELKHCVDGCLFSCQENAFRKKYSEEFYDHFLHLFGKNLRKEEDCVEICSQSCSGCDEVEISGSRILDNAWTLYTPSHASSSDIYVLDVSTWLGSDQAFESLYFNGAQLPRAQFPNVDTTNPPSTGVGYLAAKSGNAASLDYDPITFSTRVSTWTDVSMAQLHILPMREEKGNLVYKITSVNTTENKIYFSEGGAQMTKRIFTNGPRLSTDSRFKVENIFQELDSPGEWYLNVAEQKLYVAPPQGTTITNAKIEVPMLKQLLVVRGTMDSSRLEASTGTATLLEETSDTRTQHLRFEGLSFTGTAPSHLDTYLQPPSSTWTTTRIAGVYFESVDDVHLKHCTLTQMGSNGIVVFGRANDVVIQNNRIYNVAQNGIVLLAQQRSRLNVFEEPVLSYLLHPTNTHILHNRVFSFGKTILQGIGLYIVGARNTVMKGNLIHHRPEWGREVEIINPGGASSSQSLIRPIDPIVIPDTLNSELGEVQSITVTPTGFDTTIVAKIVGAPACPNVGRVSESFQARTAEGCTGCCATTTSTAKIRRQESGVATYGAWHGLSAALSPGDSFEVQATAADTFDTPRDVFIRFHKVTVHGIEDLRGPIWQTKWTLRTRPCVFAETIFPVTCGGGDCGGVAGGSGCPDAAEVDPSTSTAITSSTTSTTTTTTGVSPSLTGSMTALTCPPPSVPVPHSLLCTGPFDAPRDCGTHGIRSVMYYNCTIDCRMSSCT